MADTLLFLTELMGMRVYDLKGRRIGRVRDAGVVPRVDPARVDRFLIGGELNWWSVRHEQVSAITIDGIYLRDEQVTPYHDDEYMLRIVRDLLDQQIIDVHGRKVVRVNDVTFEVRRANAHEELCVREVDIGMRSIFRRLAQGILPPRLIRRSMSRIAPNSIRWEFCNIVEADPQRRLRLNITHTALEELHPADLADIVEDLSPEDREAIFESIDSEVAAETLAEVEDPKIQANILESLEAERAADIVEEMDPAEAADVLEELEEETSDAILEEMEPEEKTEVEEALELREDSAGRLMNSEFITLPATATVADALRAIRENPDLVDSLTTLFLEDGEGLLSGAVPVARLVLAGPGTALADLAIDELVSVPIGEHADRVIEMVDKYNLMALPVVDEAGKLVGTITADDVIAELREE
jgi:sporulation protein YlmC with PRC-barrel domain/flagellar motor switch protein FliG